jgi:hypothetical protein
LGAATAVPAVGREGAENPNPIFGREMPRRDAADRTFVSTRTRWAIVLAFTSGIAVGLFLHTVPVVLAWLIAFVGAIILSIVFGVLATDHYVIVGWSYAAGVAVVAVVASLVTDGFRGDWFGPLAQFAWIFAIVACVSLLGSLPCALVKWEDKKVRERIQESER